MMTRSKLRPVPQAGSNNREAHYYPRILAAFKHPSCPVVTATDDEAEELARFIAVRVFRFGPKLAGKMPRTAK